MDLGLLKGDVDQLIKDEAYKEFYMHRIGHWLGMDVLTSVITKWVVSGAYWNGYGNDRGAGYLCGTG